MADGANNEDKKHKSGHADGPNFDNLHSTGDAAQLCPLRFCIA